MLGVDTVLRAGESAGVLIEAAAGGWLADEALVYLAGGVDWLGEAAALLVGFGFVDDWGWQARRLTGRLPSVAMLPGQQLILYCQQAFLSSQ